MDRPLWIAVDFDSTLAMGGTFPHIGVPVPKAFATLRYLQNIGCKLLLWTCRDKVHLEEAIAFCKVNGITFDGINENPGIVFDNPISCKAYADYYIDDHNLGIPLKTHTLPSGEVCKAVDWDFVLSTLLFVSGTTLGRDVFTLDDSFVFDTHSQRFI